MFAWLARQFIARACVRQRVYREGHLTHADGSLYMGRWALFETPWLSARVHYIASDDNDRALHDHPWNFVSLVLSGGYSELRPQTVDPCFQHMTALESAAAAIDHDAASELVTCTVRRPGSIAFRNATDRHRVVNVQPRTYTVFVYGRKVQWWGFYTIRGKLHWKAFESCHAAIRTMRGGE